MWTTIRWIQRAEIFQQIDIELGLWAVSRLQHLNWVHRLKMLITLLWANLTEHAAVSHQLQDGWTYEWYTFCWNRTTSPWTTSPDKDFPIAQNWVSTCNVAKTYCTMKEVTCAIEAEHWPSILGFTTSIFHSSFQQNTWHISKNNICETRLTDAGLSFYCNLRQKAVHIHVSY